MYVNVPFLPSVAIAGVAFLIATAIIRRASILRRYYIPAPAIGALLVAAIVVFFNIGGVTVVIPESGYPLDFLNGLLVANMGLHVTPRIFKNESILFFLVLAGAFVLSLVQLALAFPLAMVGHDPSVLGRAIVMGPLSITGAPYNTTPPNQVPLYLAQILHPAFPAIASVKQLAQGQMMIGLVTGIFLAGIVGRALFNRAGQHPPRPDPDDRQDTENVWKITTQEVALIVLLLVLITLAFWAQDLLRAYFAWFHKGYLPVIVLAYLFGVAFRLLWEAIMPRYGRQFPKKSLGILLYGPIMGLTLTYFMMGMPLYNLRLISWPMVIAGFLAIAASALVAWLLFPIFARFSDRYYGAVISTAFLAITTGWGPLGMAYLRRFTDEEGPVPPMPILLPLNSFYAIPWLMTGVSYALMHFFG